jgi:hypothetical protein
MRKVLVLGAIVIGIALAGCSTYLPMAVTDNPIGSKVGEVSFKEGGVLQAAQNGNITKIATVDYKVTSFLGIPISQTYIVSGE